MNVAAIIALIGVIVTAVSLLILHIVPSGRSPVGDAISAYGSTRYRGLYLVQALAFGIAELALAVGFLPVDGAIGAVILLALLGITRLVLAFIHVDEPDGQHTGSGRIHIVLTVLGFVSATISAFIVAVVFGNVDGGIGFSDASGWLAWIMAAGSILSLVLAAVPSLRRGFGLPERLVTLAILVWTLIMSIGLITVL
jgi:hypothetical protein